MTQKMLRGLSEIRSHFLRDDTPTWSVCASPYTLMGMDEWVRGFRFISYSDCFEGQHPRVYAPPRNERAVFPYETLEELNAMLLRRPDVQARILARGPGRVAMMLFDEESEELCRYLGQEIVFNPAELRRRVDDKLESTRLAESAGVPCVPNALGPVRSWQDLQALAGHLGPHLVIQTAFGDSGTTTYFVSSPDDLEKHIKDIAAAPEVKVMKKIRCFQAAVEGCVTSAGTIVGPMLTEIVGFRELTPYPGGWSGNEVAPMAFSEAQRAAACKGTEAFGEVLRKLGWRGYFEIDWLVDLDDGSIYLGEVNPRITGASPLTNLAAFAHADAPLFLFHLLEFSNIPFELDVAALNRRWAHPMHSDTWGQLIIKHTESHRAEVLEAPRSGAWHCDSSGTLSWKHMQTHRRTVDDENDAFYLRLAAPGDTVEPGDDLGVLVVRGRLMDDARQLTTRAKVWTAGIRGQFRIRPLE